MKKNTVISLIVVAAAILSGCDPLTLHKVSSTIFDGVPKMPTAEQYCSDYHVQAKLEEKESERRQQQTQKNAQESQHPPYVEKLCNNCHDKNTESGFVVAADVLCVHCHKGFIKGNFLHGPASVGACLKCHLPHTSKNPSLLSKPKEELCGSCHAEQRVAQGIHTTSIARGMVCSDCHDPHGGNNHFFLR